METGCLPPTYNKMTTTTDLKPFVSSYLDWIAMLVYVRPAKWSEMITEMVWNQANMLLSISDAADTQRRKWTKLMREKRQTEAVDSPVTNQLLFDSYWRLRPETRLRAVSLSNTHTENLSDTKPLAQERDLRITLTFLQPLFHQYLIMISLGCTNSSTAAQYSYWAACFVMFMVQL